MRMKDKVALISGAASGMGAATARLFAREGATVVRRRHARQGGRRRRRRDRKKAGGKARYLHLDVTDESQWKAAVAEIEKSAGGLDVLVNNAGISGSAEQDLYDTAAWNRLMGDQRHRRVPRHEARHRGDEEARPRRLGDQPVVDLRHRRPGLSSMSATTPRRAPCG